jgi:hypothetical protein
MFHHRTAIFFFTASCCQTDIDGFMACAHRNVNRRGSPPVIRACLLSDRTSMREYVHDLRQITSEAQWFDAAPSVLATNEVNSKFRELMDDFDRARSGVFDNIKVLSSDRFGASEDPTVRILASQLLTWLSFVSDIPFADVDLQWIPAGWSSGLLFMVLVEAFSPLFYDAKLCVLLPLVQ